MIRFIDIRQMNGHVTHLFIAHPTSINLFRQHHDILLLDCTYRTNRYKMPLLNIAGATGMNTTLQLALVFLYAETKDDYIWALTSLQDMLNPDGNSPSVIVTDRERALISGCQAISPEAHHILCRWHMGKNVLKSCKKHFTTEEDWKAFYAQWNAVVNSITEEEYEVQLREFTMEQPILPVTYFLDNWLLEWKTKVVKAWVDHIPHFGHTVTSRIEGSHAKMKSYLGTSTSDLKGVYDKIVLYWTAQHSDYITNLALSRTRTSHQCQTPIFSALIGKIHSYALHKVSDQLNKLARPLPLCSGTYRAVNGLPCAHELLHIRTNNT